MINKLPRLSHQGENFHFPDLGAQFPGQYPCYSLASFLSFSPSHCQLSGHSLGRLDDFDQFSSRLVDDAKRHWKQRRSTANSLVTLLGDWTISINFHPGSSTTPSVTENRGDRDQSAHLLTSFSQSEHEWFLFDCRLNLMLVTREREERGDQIAHLLTSFFFFFFFFFSV